MPGLYASALEYLAAGGFTVQQEEVAPIRWVELARDGEVLQLWIDETELPASSSLSADDAAAREARERQWMDQIDAVMTESPESTGYVLVPRRQGLSRTFVSDATQRLGPQGGIRVPVEFFDNEYRWEASGAWARRSATRALLDQAAAVDRVPQPFRVRFGLSPQDHREGGSDLVRHLAEQFSTPPQLPCIRFVDGSAGIGKTVAFNALLAEVYDAFRDAKQQREARARPIAFNQHHLRQTQPGAGAQGRVDDLVQALIATEFARPVTPTQFDWLVINGHTMWMFDGLDEVYAGDRSFFRKLEALLVMPGSRAQILVCTRDSLFSSSDVTRRFVEAQLAAGTTIEIYELAPWGDPSWHALAAPSPHGESFLSQLRASPVLRELAALPFYATELLRLGAASSALQDEFDVLEVIVGRMLEREAGKGLFDWEDFANAPGAELDRDALEPDDLAALEAALRADGQASLRELLEVLAHVRARGTAGTDDLPVELVEDFVDLTQLGIDLTSRKGRGLLRAVTQFALFGMGPDAGAVDFSHPILRDYLAACYARGLLRTKDSDGAIRQAVGPAPVMPESLFHRFFVREVQRDPALAARFREARTRLNGPLSVLGFLDLVNGA